MPRLSKIGAAALAAFGWTSGAAGVTANYLVVAGGGGGGDNSAGGGGAGGYLTSVITLDLATSYTVTVGAGGAPGTNNTQNGFNGSNSQLGAIATAIGGGGGGGLSYSVLNPAIGVGNSGGSGGGGGAAYTTEGPGTGGAGTVGQGNAGGTGGSTAGGAGGGGGGAGAVGSNGNGATNTGGAGGAGTASSISGTSVTYAGGGGGAGATGGTGGSGGGGNGDSGVTAGTPGTANLGGGGGGSSVNRYLNGGQPGGSGVVIISYPAPQRFGGGIVSASGANIIHTFNTSGTLSPINSLTASYLVVAGGGGGASASGAGGGAGGLLSGSGLTLDTNSIYAITVGAGGAATGTSSQRGNSGSNSSFSMVTTTAVGGGGGGCNDVSGQQNGLSGGSGGGGGSFGTSIGTAGAATSGQGNTGGIGATDNATYRTSGGGGGAGAVGGNSIGSTGSNTGGAGGIGVASSISGTSTYYAGGGGGAKGGVGSLGGGGAAGNAGAAGTAGTANTGGGGGAGGDGFGGAAGGSGVVIISYPGSTQLMAGGTVTVAGGNVIHTFTSSGLLTPIVLATNSLRFRRSASASLTRTPTSASNRRTWTWSGWVKRGALGSSQALFSCEEAASNYSVLYFSSGNILQFYTNTAGTDYSEETVAVFRDPSAWYHVVFALDTTQATASERAKIYINGVQQTDGQAFGQIPQNYETFINSVNQHAIGRDEDGNVNYLDGYLTEVNFIDGQALTPNSFGTFNGLGVWQPVRYGGSYGTNGFYLPFTNNTAYYSGLFDGATQTAYVGYNTVLNLGTTAYTVEAFVNPTSLSNANGQNQVIGRWNSGINERSYLLIVNNDGSVSWAVSTNGNTGAGNSISVTSAAGKVAINRWTHIRISQTGNTVYLGIDGTIVTTATDAIFGNVFSTTNTVALGASLQGDTGTVFTGYISNVRIVKGTALSTTTYTVPTAPLTAISGTSLLTLQSSTLIDNSGNSLTITNPSNNPTISIVAPTQFGVVGYGKDFSSSNNNWTTNNLSYASGATYDSMTDVPTLTSATAANYCVFNPLDSNAPVNAPSQTITNGNLKMTNTTAAHSVTRATIASTSGKFYWEIKVDVISNFYSGIYKTNTDLTTTVGADSNSYAYVASSGDKRYNGTSTAYGSALTAGDVLGCALDLDSGKIWWSVNGTFQASGNPAAGTNEAFSGISGEFTAAAGCYQSTININFGQQPFFYTPPTGFVRLNTFNLPTPTIGATASTQANKYMDINLYTGNSTARSIVNSGGFEPAWVWIKNRSGGNSHRLFDIVRGATKALASNSTAVEFTESDALTAFNSNGFSLGTDVSGGGVNTTGDSLVAWQWNAGGSTVTNTSGSISAQVRANTSAGFSVVTYTGTGANATVGHGLGVAPRMVICKRRTTAGGDWQTYHASLGATRFIKLNTTDAAGTATSPWNDTAPTSTVFSLGTNGDTNLSGASLVAYCFSEVAGYSAFGSYTGNGSADGTFVYTGFRPAFILIKKTDTSGTDWSLMDSKRLGYNATDVALNPNASNAENSGYATDFTSNGFKLRTTTSFLNGSGGTYIYMAFAESPFKYANAR
jgi:hypothetical protein